MKNIWNVAVLLTGVLGLAACGGNGGSEGTPMPDTTAPSIVSITPASGATGVAKDANIVVTFSEKMDQAATQSAYESTDLPPSEVTFSWNAAGTILTINPKADLLYTAAGKVYSFYLTSAATDLAGNALPLKNAIFKTYRQITASFVTRGGRVRSDGNVVFGDPFLIIGDDDENRTSRVYFSFDLRNLPATLEISNIVAAKVSFSQFSFAGSPYTDLAVDGSGLILEHVDYGASLTGAAFDATVYANLGDISNSDISSTYSRSTLSAVLADLSAKRTRSQYRLRFAKLTDGDKKFDATGVNDYSISLEIIYLIL